MISLPILQSLDVADYGLYPGGDPATLGLQIRFHPGLTLVIGTNGLGKTTLVTMLYRLLTGPYDIPALARNSDLGTASLEVTRLNPRERGTFAQRVADGAARASARLVFDVGGEEVSVERDLRNLALRSFSVGKSAPSQDELQYQQAMANLANVSAFGDWILLLRYIVFYFENRSSLVWDPSAQRQLLRILFLERDKAQNWTTREREILQIETRVRNMRAVATGEERTLAGDESFAATEPEAREELQDLEKRQRNDDESLEEINSNRSDIEAYHESARLRYLTLQQTRESQYREIERAQLIAVNARLPQYSDSARYILAQLLADAECLVCGSNVPNVAESMKSRIRGLECIMCGSDLTTHKDQIPVEFPDESISDLEDKLQSTEAELETARKTLQESEDERKRADDQIQELRTTIAYRTARVDALLRLLPTQEGELHERRREVASLRGRIGMLQRDLDEKRESFTHIIDAANSAVEKQASEVMTSFSDYAHEFLFEDCRLIWAPQLARLGQIGRRFYFPAFELELGGSDFSGTFRRSVPGDVSESQREFIDISFRMALAKVATKLHVTSLVMDAPESSLDAIFVTRAARVLGALGRPETGNRLIVASNLVDGKLIPSLLKEAADKGDRNRRVVDLLTGAAPTAALRSLRCEYDAARDRLLQEADAFE